MILAAVVVATGCSSGTTNSAAPRPKTTSTTVAGATTTATTRPGTAVPTTRAGLAPSGGAAAGTSPCGWSAAAPATYQHVIWILMENHTWGQVLGNRSAAPYEVALAAQCASATHFDNVGSPSLPNYLGATSGSNQGISDDSPPSSHPLTVDNLFRQVRTAGGTERSYEESMTAPCQQSSAGEYAVKHNPAAYYLGPGNQDRAACQADDVSFSEFGTDLVSGRLPTFSFITPNLCDDTHDCGVSTGDQWLSRQLPPILQSAAYRRGTTAVFVIWDEYSPIPNIEIAPSVHPGTVVSQSFNDFALLRTTEEMLALPPLAGAAGAADLRGPFNL